MRTTWDDDVGFFELTLLNLCPESVYSKGKVQHVGQSLKAVSGIRPGRQMIIQDTVMVFDAMNVAGGCLRMPNMVPGGAKYDHFMPEPVQSSANLIRTIGATGSRR